MRRLLLRSYPSAWRQRYGDELLALLDETGFGPREALDMLRSGLRLRIGAMRGALLNGGIEMVIGPAWRHPTGWALVGALLIAPTIVALGWSALFNVAIANDALDRVRAVDLVLVLAPLAGLAAALAPLLRLELRRGRDGEAGGTEAVIGLRLRAANLVVGGFALLLGSFLLGHIVIESVLRLGA